MKRSMLFFGMVLLTGGLFFEHGPLAFSAVAEGKKELMPLGGPAPDFHLKDVVSGKIVSRDDLAAKRAMLVVFLCRHCPYVQHTKATVFRKQAGQNSAQTSNCPSTP